jgi:hypothetical protein
LATYNQFHIRVSLPSIVPTVTPSSSKFAEQSFQLLSFVHSPTIQEIVVAFKNDVLVRDSPDESQRGINVRLLSALLQDRREVLSATSSSGNRTLVQGLDLAIFPGIWTHVDYSWIHDIEHLTLALVVAAAVAPR